MFWSDTQRLTRKIKLMNNQAAAKNILRQQLQEIQKSVMSDQIREADTIITRKLKERLEWKHARIICIYVSILQEVDTKNIIGNLFREGKTVSVPRIISPTTMTLHQIVSFSDLVAGSFGIFEPKPTTPVIPPNSVDLFIVPGVAFDVDKHRLGRGRGYYDRLLRGVRVPKIG